jgi:hypothetical protein
MIAAMTRLEEAISPYLDEIERRLRKPAPEDALPTFNTRYRPVNPEARTNESEPFQVDPDVIDRGKRSHRELQEKLRDLAERRGLEPRSPGGPDPDFDIGWWQSRAAMVVIECKSTTARNEEKQLRLGLGQVLDYAHRGQRGARKVIPVLAVENRPRSARWEALCAKHGVRLVWPGTFHTLFR